MRATLILLSLLGADERPEPAGPPRHLAGGGFAVAVPAGEFKDFVGNGYGAAGFAAYGFGERGILGARAGLAYVQYGSETIRRPLLTGRILADITTSNNIVWLGFGPQLTWPAGWFIRPYGQAGIGLSYFFTESSISGSSNVGSFANTTNFDDVTFAWNAGGGLLVPITGGHMPISVDLGAQYVSNGRARYLREGSIVEAGDGSISFTPIESRTNLTLIQLGVAVGLR